MNENSHQIIDSVEKLEAAIARVKAAQAEFATYSQEQVDAIFKAAAVAANQARIPLAKMAVEETGMGDTSYLAVLPTVLGAPFCEELLVRGIIFEFSLRAFNPQCRPLWKRRRRASAQDGAMVPWAAPSTWGIAAAIVLQAAIFGFMHMNWVQGCYAGAAGLIFGWVLVTTGKLRYTILLHFAFNAGSYLMTLLWFVNTPLDVAVTVAIAGFVLVEAMRSLHHACGMDAASALLP